ncbi:MAG: glucokinase [Alphaproteobacteria bacterium]|nr:glucokinase [Alphaproteobacteria bacterium]MBL6937000.1 glucokinase [Alphaproteobacteria bacterium]MBL7097769.1 glucokinase [Alphaproteobacteria bacterium]
MSAVDQILVGDIGGTHSRFAVVDVSQPIRRIEHRRDLGGTVTSFNEALRTYLDRAGLPALPGAIALSVAGPVTAGAVVLTNRAWQISEQDLRAFGFRDVLLINDFAALAFAVSSLEPAAVRTIGPSLEGLPGEPISIVGAGTGFGAACLARFHNRTVPVATEGGHAGFAPGNDREMAVLKVLAGRFGHVSIERVLSGPGIGNLYGALMQIAGRRALPLDAAEIVARRAADENCRDAIDLFCAIYGAVAGDFALMHGARGGVFLAGGIAQKIEPVLAASAFRERFENKGRLSHYVKGIPTKLILSEDTAYIGIANASLAFRDAAEG